MGFKGSKLLRRVWVMERWGHVRHKTCQYILYCCIWTEWRLITHNNSVCAVSWRELNLFSQLYKSFLSIVDRHVIASKVFKLLKQQLTHNEHPSNIDRNHIKNMGWSWMAYPYTFTPHQAKKCLRKCKQRCTDSAHYTHAQNIIRVFALHLYILK